MIKCRQISQRQCRASLLMEWGVLRERSALPRERIREAFIQEVTHTVNLERSQEGEPSRQRKERAKLQRK